MATVEVWLRGETVEGVPPLLQPVAHSLLQCREEVMAALPGLSAEQVWARRGAASIGFHVRHAAGSLDRLLTYARGESLSPAQMAAFKAEQEPDLSPDAGAKLLVAFDEAVGRALDQLRGTSADTLLDRRGVGRAQLPTTVVGLLFHAAEHTQRHVGQLATTIRLTA
jgi:uncharacterized damage-inducible protein DinB